VKTYLNDTHYEICLNFRYLASLSVTIIFAYTSGFWSLQASAVGFQTYRNPALGFSIDYPSEWKIWEDRISNENVTFIMPPVSESLTLYDAPFIIHVREATPYLDTDTMTIKNKPVDQVAQQMMKNLSEQNPLGLEFRPIRSNQSTLAGMPGWKIEAFLGPEVNPFYYFFDVFTITNGKVYHLLYGEKPLKVPETYPIVKRMLDSFHIFKPNATQTETINTSIGYKSLFERTTEPKSFTYEEQATIDMQCNTIQENLSSLTLKDRKWFWANCLEV
jgi:hypothetical protein